nr:T9SS type A sorting domain-containing protein [Candidatus Cloacimonadota bacterium]
GAYWLWIGPSVFTGYPCTVGNNDYVATLTCEPYAPPPCDVIEDPCWINSIPATLTGNSCEYNNDYDEVCPYSGSTAHDVVYAYTPEVDMTLDLSMCSEGNWYDTKLYVYENEETPGAPYACNDDYCSNSHQSFLSFLGGIDMYAGNTYYIIVDGYGGECGDYELIITECVPCIVECPEWGIPEGEVCPEDGYVDDFNGGCNSEPPVFSPIECSQTICGTASTYLFDGSNYRDTDWYELILEEGTWDLTWTAIAEFPLLIFLIDAGSGNCVDYTILGSASGNPCEEVSLSAIVTGGTYWLWVGPSVFSGWPCNDDNDYVATLTCEPYVPGQGETCETAIPYTYVGDPAQTGSIVSYQEVWYSFEALEDFQEVYVDLCDSDFDTKLEVWYNCDDPTYTYYNDDYCGVQSYIQTGCMFEGDVWYAKVYGYGSAFGNYVLLITGLPGVPPEPPPNDDCENAEYIPQPYPASGSGTTIAATLDCSGVLDWNGVWYLFDLPYAENAVTIDICGFNEDIWTVGIVLMDDCLCDDYIIRDEGYYYECPSGFDGYHMEWWNIPGPGQMYWPAYAVASGDVGMDFDYTLNVTEVTPCVVECPEWGITEGEVCPEDGYVDDFNGGCNSEPPVFSPIECSQTICGTASTYLFDGSNYRDTDWYELILEEGTWDLTWTAIAEFPLLIFLIDAGSGNCVDYTILGSASGNPCEEVSLSFNVGAGTYWLWVGTSVFTGFPCDEGNNDYVATLTCGPWGPGPGETCDTAIPYPNVNDPPVSGPLASYQAIWYSFTAGEEFESVTVSLCGSDFDTILEVWLDCAGPSYTYYNDDYCGLQSEITTGYMAEGETWYANFYGYGGAGGNYILTITGVGGGPTYCPASGGCDEYIERIQIGTIDNTSLCDGYADYTYLSTDLYIGVGAPLTLTIGNAWESDVGGAWVDWNQDLDFYDDGEFFDLGSGVGPYVGNIVPPAVALPGPIRMRIRIQYGGVLDPCGSTSYGEVEDYTVNVVSCGEPVLCVVPPGYDFGGVPIGDCSPPQTFTIDNCGIGTIEVYSVTITGPDVGEFILTDLNTYPVTLPPAITVDVEFCPADAGTKTAFLTITDNREVTDFPLYGTGYIGLVCPEGTIFGQPSHMPEDDWSAGTSEDDPVYGIDYIVYDNFWGLEEPICNIHFWGLSLVYPWAPCDEDPMPFEIKFYLDDGSGYPGDEVCSYTETIYREATEQYYAGYPLFYFSTELNPCCDISDGWVSIQGQLLEEPPNCWFMWMSSGIGDGFCYQSLDGGVTYNDRFYDQAMCLTGPSVPETSLILPEYVEGCPGQAVSIPVYLDNPDAWEVEGIDMVITFDETVLDATGGILGPELAALGYGLFVNTDVDGQVTVVIYAMTDVFNGSGDIIFLEFNVVGVEGDYTDLVFDFGEVNETPVALFDGFFDVIPCLFDISGYISYYSDANPVPNADVDITGDATYVATTDGYGEYLFLDIPGGNYESTPFKDTDLGGLSGLDASRAARYSAGLYELDCLEMIAGDVSMDGSINGMDPSKIARYSIEIIDYLNDDCIDWVFTPEPIPECEDWPPIVYEDTREYIPLISDLTDEDFIGIRLGDVTGNWSPGVRTMLAQSSTEATDIEIDINYTLRIPVVIEEATAIEGIDISIEFNPEVLQLTEFTLNEGILYNKDYAVETNFEEAGKGKIVIYALSELVSESGIVAFIEFNVIGEEGSGSEVYFTKFDVNEIEASGGLQVLDSEGNEIVTRRLEVNIVQPLPEKFSLYPNYPNPFTSKTLIKYDLPKDTHVVIQIYNIKGQLVEELINGFETAGGKEIEWNADKNVNGIYFLKMSTRGGSSSGGETNNHTFIKKMLLLR